jgi:Na+-driven multidrug efflux pump
MEEKNYEKSKRLGNEKIGKLLFKLSLPATIGMLVMALYNLVDTIFIGQGVGMNGIGGVAIVFSYYDDNNGFWYHIWYWNSFHRF